MKFIALGIKRAAVALVCLCALLATGLPGLAEGDTTLTVELRGVTPANPSAWRSVTLGGRFEVLCGGEKIGEVRANPTDAQRAAGESDTLVLTDAQLSDLAIAPIAQDAAAGFDYAASLPVTVVKGQENRATFFAYAQRGFFSVRNLAGGQAASGAEFTVLDETGAERFRFATDESGAYTSDQPLDNGAYRLRQTRAAEGATLREDEIPFTVSTYNGDAASIAMVRVESELAPTLDPTTAASMAGGAPLLGEGQTVTAVSLYAQANATTDANGDFRLEPLLPGDYTVYLPLPEGATLAEGSAWSVSEQGDMVWLTVSLKENEAYQLPEATFVASTGVVGVAFMDGNGDGAYALGETLMSGVPVALQALRDGAWAEVASATTDEYGAFAFSELSTGTYRLAAKATGGVCVASVGGGTAIADGWMVSGELTLGDGDHPTLNVALAQAATLKVSAFSDSNENGERGIYERSISGVRVEVLAPDATIVASGATDTTGEAAFSNLAPGKYQLRFTLPDGYLYTVKGGGTGADSSCVGGAEGAAALSDTLTLESGRTYGAGVAAIPVGSFSGRVWNDLNNDGLMQDGEPGMPGVTLTLSGVKTGRSYSLVSGEDGLFRFALLRNDTYNFTAAIPEGTMFARYSQTGGDSRSVFTVDGISSTRQFVVSGAENVANKNVGVIQPATLRGTAFLDLNYNGLLDEGEPAYAGVTLEVIKNSNSKSMGRVVTGTDGSYVFTGLRGGSYRLRAILPDDGSTFTLVPSGASMERANLFAAREGRRENSIPSVSVTNGAIVDTVVGVARGATISGKVFVDSAYDGVRNDKDKAVSGVKVQLTDALGNVIASDTTNANGSYALEGVMPGTYTVRFQRKSDYAYTRYRPNEAGGSHVVQLGKDGYGVTEALTVAMGEDIGDINAGTLPSSTISGVLFDDLNDDGLRDGNEAGFTDASVRLVSSDGELDLTEAIGTDGSYFFDGVMPGTYTLTYLLPERAVMADVAAGGNTQAEPATQPFVIEMGKSYSMSLAGAVTLGSLEGTAFHDRNANGARDEGEETMSGVTVTLAPDRAGLEPVSAVTGADGAFALEALRPASYQLTLALPEGYIFSYDLSASSLKLETANSQTLACPWSALTNRAQNWLGMVEPAEITGSVWLDENKDGAQAADERLLTGLRLELVDEKTHTTVKTISSDDSGVATFSDVRPGTYTVRFAIPAQAEPADDAASTFAKANAYMVHSGITVAEGERYGDVHTGLVSRTSLGGRLYLDENGVRSPVSGIAVRLYQDGAELATVATDENGSYRFDGLWPGDYVVKVTRPDGTIFVRPDDANYGADASLIVRSADGLGESDAISLRMAEHQTALNILLIKPAKVGDMAWLDSNCNGLVDADEPILGGIEVALIDASGAEVTTTLTNAWGYYLLENVYPGTYTLRVRAYPELAITKPVPALRIISSCLTSGDGTEATSDPFDVVSGSKNFDNDFGFILKEGATLPAEILPAPTQDWSVSYAPEGEATK